MAHNPLAMMNEEQRRRVITAALRHDKTTVIGSLRMVSVPGFRSIAAVPEPLIIRQLVRELPESLFLASLVLKAWFEANGPMQEEVRRALTAQGYTAGTPDFSGTGFTWQDLQDKDVRVTGDLSFFSPGGEPLAGFDPFDVTLMALLLGWFVSPR